MKLVELLARELVEWPEGAKRASQDKDKEIRFDTSWNDFYVETLADDAGVDFGDGVIVTREEWEAEREKVKGKAEWNGEGLPPVGVVCLGLSECDGEWKECEIVSHHKGAAVAVFPHGGAMVSRGVRYRPAPSAEQIAAQEREEAAQQMLSVAEDVGAGMYTICCALYDAGYRKQEQSE